jgi:hypothetical protein
LVVSALLGYALGATWLAPALGLRKDKPTHNILYSQTHVKTATDSDDEHTHKPQQSDPRSATLRVAHTLVDALLATAIILVWQRLYGAEETGWLSALLRVLGFLPAIVHMAWAQVALAKAYQNNNSITARTTACWMGLGAFACVILGGISCALALYLEWLNPNWSGMWPYITPLVLWQGSACLSAAFCHRPFQTQHANRYSYTCMALGVLQGVVLLVPMGWTQPISPEQHMFAFALLSSIGLLGMTVWLARLR